MSEASLVPIAPTPEPAAPKRALFSSVVAHWFDEVFHLPGTQFRFGLDSLLALIPGIGDAAATGFGATILLEAVRHRAPFRLLVRMGANMGLNTLLDAIPFAAPVLTAWFKSNSRNHAMLKHHIDGQGLAPRSTQSKILLVLVLVFALAIIGLNLLCWYSVYRGVQMLMGSGSA
jgi:Domain of unknown function (DUF4112)